jgi:hypothetical protein
MGLNNFPGINLFVLDKGLRFEPADGSEMKNTGLSRKDIQGKQPFQLNLLSYAH